MSLTDLKRKTGAEDRQDLGRRGQVIIWLFLLFLLSFLLSAAVGSVTISLSDMAAVLTGEGQPMHRNILFHIRLPRTAACALAGGGLAVAGAVIQNVLQNPLAGPNIIGVNAGAGLAVVVCSYCFPTSFGLMPAAAFLGALSAMLFIYGLAKKTGASKVTLVLAGVSVNSLLNAASDMVHTFGNDTLTSTYSFRLGGFGGVSVQVLIPAGILIGIAFLLVCLFSNELEVLSMGEEVASSLGLNTRAFRFLFLVLAAVLAGASVSFAGLLGFVGLIAPHIARRLVGEECRYLLPFCALFGACFVMVCDLAARTLWSPYEIPTGILLSFVGAPFFLSLLFRQRRRRRHD